MYSISKDNLAKEMEKFWDDHAHKADTYPSLDIYYKDGSELKFFIQSKEYMEMPVVVATVTYVGEDVIEFKPFAPLVNKLNHKMKDYIQAVLGELNKRSIDVEKPIKKIVKNLV